MSKSITDRVNGVEGRHILRHRTQVHARVIQRLKLNKRVGDARYHKRLSWSIRRDTAEGSPRERHWDHPTSAERPGPEKKGRGGATVTPPWLSPSSSRSSEPRPTQENGKTHSSQRDPRFRRRDIERFFCQAAGGQRRSERCLATPTNACAGQCQLHPETPDATTAGGSRATVADKTPPLLTPVCAEGDERAGR
ncbi:hypothetical protein HYQ46_003904 [Verticillium longisporum]|nr:hypothetical protein HYQ46_003904 [Verticillium longisporum]